MPPRRTPARKRAQAVERRFADIDAALEQLTLGVRRVDVESAAELESSSAKRRARLALQGRYGGLMRRLKPSQRVRVKAVKDEKGLEAAIEAAKRLAGK